MRIIAYTIEPVEDRLLITDNRGIRIAGNDLDLLLQCLVYNEDEPALLIMWDLDATIAPLLKLLGEENCRKLAQTNKCFYRPFSIFYIPSKIFSIKPVFRHERTNFYDLEQYYPDREAPRTVKEIAELGNKLLEALAEMKLYPTKLTSSVAMWEQCVMNYLNLPTVHDMPQEAAEYAWLCSGKLWTEAYTLGYFPQAYDYDISGSFPSIARDLIDIRHCEWVKSTVLPPGTYYGYVYCMVTIYSEVTVSPIIHQDEQSRLSTPTGTWKTYLTLGEILFIIKHKIGKVDIIDGWWAIPSKLTYPMQATMNRLLSYKDNNNELVRILAKRMSVGVYGKFGEEWADRFGKHFNPCWFAEISTRVRLQVAEFIYRHKLQDNLIHVSVDGVLVDKEVEL